jgi:microcompartment protein CcmK/EutM
MLNIVSPLRRISRDGTLLAYTTRSRIQISRIGDWPPGMILGIEDDGEASDWSADNKRLLVKRYLQPGIYVHDVPSGRESLFMSKPGYELFQAKFSPDNRAVVLVACDSQGRGIDCQLFIVQLKSDGSAEAPNWIGIDHPTHWDDKPRWSLDGKLLYFLSDRDGHFCLRSAWSRTKRPMGNAFPLYRFHNSRLAMINVGTSALEIDVARNKIVMGLGELTGISGASSARQSPARLQNENLICSSSLRLFADSENPVPPKLPTP